MIDAILFSPANTTWDGPDALTRQMLASVVYLCDWLPPDFGAVGQYSLEFARQRAARGEDVVLAGLSSTANDVTQEQVGTGRLTVLRFQARPYDRNNLRQRAWWTLRVN